MHRPWAGGGAESGARGARMTSVRILGPREARELVTGPDAVRIIEEVFRGYGEGTSRLSCPSAMSLEAVAGAPLRFKLKGAAVDAAGVAGFRVIALPDPDTGAQHSSCCYVYDTRSGRPLGFVDETRLHRLRTAATGAVAVKYLARRAARVVTLFGAGAIAEELVPLLPLVLDMGELRVSSRRRESMEGFAARHRGRVGSPVRAVSAAREAVAGADVVVTLTEATEPIVKPGWLAPGCFVCSMGSHHEIDIGVLDEADRFVVDDLDYAMEMGDVAAWVRKGQATRERVAARLDADIGQVVSGTRAGRRSDADRVLGIIQGMAIGDVALAAHALRRAEEQGLGAAVPWP